MLLAIDIGNTAITVGVLKNTRVMKTARIETRLKPSVLNHKLARLFKSLQRAHAIENVVICSVVPKATRVVETAVKSVFHQKPIVVGRDVSVPIKNCYAKPREVGQDRLVCAFAAAKIYGAPAIVIDLGTAITVDIVSRKKEYLGGLIIPGIRLSAESLFEKTALLPRVRVRKPASVIGKDTQGSILSGIFYGYGEMLKGLIGLLAQKLHAKPQVIMTGGYASLMKAYMNKRVDVMDADLIFKGLALLARDSVTP